MPTPCESWPRRLASTRLVATIVASRSDEPPAFTMAWTAAVSLPASNKWDSVMGWAAVMGAPLSDRNATLGTCDEGAVAGPAYTLHRNPIRTPALSEEKVAQWP